MLTKIKFFFFSQPVLLLILSFLGLILIGTILLSLPFSTQNGISLIDALFTATSAACVTGLIVKDTFHDFTFFGQLSILLLIQFGGIGILTFGVFFLKFLRLPEKFLIKEIYEVEFFSQLKKSLAQILIITFSVEAVGALVLYYLWKINFSSQLQALYFSIFHSISAFSNAGFSLFINNFENFSENLGINLTLAILIIIGGLGFFVLKDLLRKLLSFIKRKRIQLSLHSKIILTSSLLLIILGAILFGFFEKENLGEFSFRGKILIPLFQSITARTAGFNTINIGELTSPTLFLLMILMFIGGAPASTAGGIKVVTVVVLICFLISYLRRKEPLNLFKREVSLEIIKKATAITLFSIILVACIFLALLYTEKKEFKEVLFETISAFGTVGLSTGITSQLSLAGKILIIVLMLLGRIGPLSLVIICAKEIFRPKVRYPQGKIYLG